jgi:hypothetical protein
VAPSEVGQRGVGRVHVAPEVDVLHSCVAFRFFLSDMACMLIRRSYHHGTIP